MVQAKRNKHTGLKTHKCPQLLPLRSSKGLRRGNKIYSTAMNTRLYSCRGSQHKSKSLSSEIAKSWISTFVRTSVEIWFENLQLVIKYKKKKLSKIFL